MPEPEPPNHLTWFIENQRVYDMYRQDARRRGTAWLAREDFGRALRLLFPRAVVAIINGEKVVKGVRLK